MINAKRKASGVLCMCLLFLCITVRADQPKNIILFIGDGMGVSQLTAAKILKGELAVEQFKTVGFLTTHSTSFVTDSAAGGTALATGFKTNNGVIGMDKNHVVLRSSFEFAHDNGFATGLVSTSAVNHATPASFVAHVKDRNMYEEIAKQIASSKVDLIFGGGRGYFLPQSDEHGLRQDDRNLLGEMSGCWSILKSSEEVLEYNGKLPVIGLFAQKHMPRVAKRTPSLAQMTRKAIELLSKEKEGFVLMVEGSQIDWGGHGNDSDYVASEAVDFDDAVGVGYEFAQTDKQTLVIVTADHETGGYALHAGSVKEKRIDKSGFTTGGHTATMVPLFAHGPGSSELAGINDNTHIARTMIRFITK